MTFGRLAYAATVAVLWCWIVLMFAARLSAYAARGLVGTDYMLMHELGQRWMTTGSMYAPWQFAPFAFNAGAGGQDVTAMPGLYPPLMGPVFALLTASPVVWWGVPLAVMAWAVWRLRPGRWAALGMLVLLTPPLVLDPFITGNPTMWFAAMAAAGAVAGWPAVLILAKPTLAPFALLGLVDWRRSALALGVLAAVSVPMLPEWVRYVDVLRNMQGAGLAYSLWAHPLLGVWVVAWASAYWRATEEPPPAWVRSGRDRDRLVVGAEPVDVQVVVAGGAK